MILRMRHTLTAALRLLIVATCLWAIWFSWTLARGDFLFRQNTEESLRQAISIVPDAWEYYLRLAQFDPAHARTLLSTAIRLDQFDAEADIELGLQYEAKGDLARAERCLLRAFAVNRTYLPRWTLANFYLRRGDMQAFWIWARRAAEMPSDNTEALFSLCWRVSPDPNEISQRLLDSDPKLLRQYLAFLLAKNQTNAAAGIATRLLRIGNPNEDAPRMFSVIDRLVAAGDGEGAKTVWTTLIANHWIVADATFPNNPTFVRAPLPVSFDWEIPSSPGCHSLPGPYGLETDFSGLEPEHCTLAEQAVVLAPGNYLLNFSYRTEGIPKGTGLRWEVLAAGSESALAESSDLSSPTQSWASFAFTVPPGVSVAHLRLIYQRALGTPLIEGALDVSSVQIHALPKP